MKINHNTLAFLQFVLIIVMVVLCGLILKYGRELSAGPCKMCEKMNPHIECINPKTDYGGILSTWGLSNLDKQTGEWLIEPTK